MWPTIVTHPYRHNHLNRDWKSVLEYFKKSEDNSDGPCDFHGIGGEWRVEGQRVKYKVLEKFRDAAEEVGHSLHFIASEYMRLALCLLSLAALVNPTVRISVPSPNSHNVVRDQKDGGFQQRV